MPASAGMISQMAGKTVDELLGAGQLIGGLIGRGKNQRNLNNLQNPTYAPNKAISDYYQTALDRANTSPYASNFYQEALKQAGRGVSTGIGALQDRRSGVGNIGALVQGSDDQLQKAGVQAEGLQRQAFGQLGQATQMKAGDDRYAFGINQEQPFERKYSEISGKLQANNQMINSGIQNFSQGLTGGQAPNVGGYGGLGGIGSLMGMGKSSGGAPQYSYTPSLANTGGGGGDPAAGINYIDPNSFSSGVLVNH